MATFTLFITLMFGDVTAYMAFPTLQKPEACEAILKVVINDMKLPVIKAQCIKGHIT